MRQWLSKLDEWFSQLQFKYQVLIGGLIIFFVAAGLIHLAGV